MSLCLETAFLVLKNVRQPLLPHHHVTSPICQLIYISLQNLSNEAAQTMAAATTATGPSRQAAASSTTTARMGMGWGRSRQSTTEEVHREASLNLLSLVRTCARACGHACVADVHLRLPHGSFFEVER